jgi:hypothetical protein
VAKLEQLESNKASLTGSLASVRSSAQGAAGGDKALLEEKLFQHSALQHAKQLRAALQQQLVKERALQDQLRSQISQQLTLAAQERKRICQVQQQAQEQ